jgi:molybdopterin-guanine dinucleotide biosynthesis protein A
MGREKALLAFDGRPLVAYAVERLRPQVGALVISANGDPARFAGFAAPVLADAPEHRDAGPLAGVAAALAYAQRGEWPLLATAPCDAPFAPADFVLGLAETMTETGAAAAVIESPRGLEPLFALWRADAFASLRDYLGRGGRSPRDLLVALGAARVRFASGEAFANLNSPAELERARPRRQ